MLIDSFVSYAIEMGVSLNEFLIFFQIGYWTLDFSKSIAEINDEEFSTHPKGNLVNQKTV